MYENLWRAGRGAGAMPNLHKRRQICPEQRISEKYMKRSYNQQKTRARIFVNYIEYRCGNVHTWHVKPGMAACDVNVFFKSVRKVEKVELYIEICMARLT